MTSKRTGTLCIYCGRAYVYRENYCKHIQNRHPEFAHIAFRTSHGSHPDENEEIYEHIDAHPVHRGPQDSDWDDSDSSDSDSDGDGVEDMQLPRNDLTRVDAFVGAGEPIGDSQSHQDFHQALLDNPWAPFRNNNDFKLGCWLQRTKMSKAHIDEFFQLGLATSFDLSFTSSYTLEKQLKKLDPLGHLLEWMDGEVDDGRRKSTFFYRNPVSCVRYLLHQKVYEKDLVYAPVKEYNSEGERMYSEMHTADWWWEKQETLPQGTTIVPVICSSDQTHLTNFSGDKKAWPIYLTIGNIISKTRNSPSMMAHLLLALLPIPPKFRKLSSTADDEQRLVNRQTLSRIIGRILRPLEDAQGVEIDCADGKRRRCHLFLAGWVADHEEHVTLHNLDRRACPRCEVNADSLGNPPNQRFTIRDHAVYREKLQRFWETDDEQYLDFLTSRQFRGIYNVFWGLSNYVVDIANLHKPDLLHNIYLGLLKHLMEWIEGFLEANGRMKAFDDAWGNLPAYPGFTTPKKTYREVIQWQGKEMRNLGRILLPVLAVALQHPAPAQRLKFKKATLCVRAFIDFHLMAQYRSHTEETLGFMESYLAEFHRYKDVFLEFRASKKTKAKVKEKDKELRDTQQDAQEQLREGRKRISISARREQDAERKRARVQLREDICLQDSHFNFIKMHLLTHFRRHVVSFGNIPMYSTESSETAHRTQIKDGYRRSNKNNATKQILDRYDRQHAISMRLQTIQSLGQERVENNGNDENDKNDENDENDRNDESDEVREDAMKVIPRRRLRGGERRIERLKDITKLEEFSFFVRDLLRYGQNITDANRVIPRDEEQLLSCLVERFTQLEIPVLKFQEINDYDVHHARCTGAKTFRGAIPRNDWVWIWTGEENRYGALRGRLVGRLVGLFKIRNSKTHVQRLAYVQMLQPLNGGNIVDDHGLVRVALGANWGSGRDKKIVDIGNILGLAHLVEEGPGKWLVNSRIDLKTFNDIY